MFHVCEASGDKVRNPKKLQSIKHMLNVYMQQEEDLVLNGGGWVLAGWRRGEQCGQLLWAGRRRTGGAGGSSVQLMLWMVPRRDPTPSHLSAYPILLACLLPCRRH